MTNASNATLQGVSIALLYYSLLCTKQYKNLQVGDVVLSEEK